MQLRCLTYLLRILCLLPACAVGQGLEIFDNLQAHIISISETVKPTVVHLEVVKKINNQRFEVVGSGIIISPDGYILTNEHLVDKQIKVRVILESKLEYLSEVIGTDKLTDLALLKITVPPEMRLPTACLGNSDSVRVGQWVLAIGNPYGFDRTVSFGIISGKGRVLNLADNVPLLNDFLQTDAAIDPGSSGGPLVDLNGRVIGINSIGVGRMQGFTIPINIAIDVKDKLLASGTIERGHIGIVTQPLNRSFARFYGMPELEGIVVADVYENQPAAKAGIRPGDVIVEFDGIPVAAETEDDLNRFSVLVAQAKVGETKPIKVMRQRKTIELRVQIGQKPKVKAEEYETEFDFTVKEITDEMFRQYPLQTKEGVYVDFVEVGSAADKAGLQPGDVIVGLADTPIKGLTDFRQVLQLIGKPEFLLLRVLRGKDHLYALLDLAEKPQSREMEDSLPSAVSPK